MCGLVGIAFLGEVPDELEKKRQQIAWFLGTELLIATQTRGEDATGIITLFNNSNYIGLKMGTPASDFVARFGGKETDYDGFFKIWNKTITQTKTPGINAKLFMGHCRKKTTGSHLDNNNNHPIHVPPIIGVHNGGITNHDTIFDLLETKRIGQVDSEAIFHLLHKFTEEGTLPFTKDILLDVTRRLTGSYAVIAANSNNPYQVALFRDGRPLILHIIKPLNMIVISSEEALFKIALYRYNKEVKLYDGLFGVKKEWPFIAETDIETVIMKDDSLAILSLSEVLPKTFKGIDIIKEHAIPRNNKIWEKKNGYHYTEPVKVTPTIPPAVVIPSYKQTTPVDTAPYGYFWINNVEGYSSLSEKEIEEMKAIGEIELTLSDTDIDTKIDKNLPVKTEQNIVPDTTVKTDQSKALVISVEMKKNPEGLKKANDYINKLEILKTEKDIAEAAELPNITSVNQIELTALVNKIRRRAAEAGFYNGYTEGVSITDYSKIYTPGDSMACTKRLRKKENFIKTTKKMLDIFTMAIEEFNENLTTKKRVGTFQDFLTEAVALCGKNLYIEDLQALFKEKEVSENNLYKELLLKLPAKTLGGDNV